MIVAFVCRLAVQAVVAGVCLLTTYPTRAGETLGPVTDPIGVIKIPARAPIQIGGYWVLSGADTALGLDSKRGAEIAIADIGDKLLGHPIKLNVEDDLCSAEGGQTAATKLASNPQTVAVLGGACSSAATPAAPILWQAGITNICTGCSAPSLTAPNRGPAYDGFARTIASDIDQGAADARYLYEVVKARTIVTVHDGSPYAQQLTAVAAVNFTKLGGKVLSQEAIAPTDIDMHPVLTRVASEKPDALYLPISLANGASLVGGSGGHGGNGGGGGIEHVAKIDSAGNLYIGKRALRDAEFAVKFDGLSGRIACDAYGQCEEFKPGVYEFVSDDPKTFSIGTNPKKIWP
jgi:branched-chain amino acid transport system substrate-binding protein